MIVSNTWDMATLVIQFKTMRQVHIENALLLGFAVSKRKYRWHVAKT